MMPRVFDVELDDQKKIRQILKTEEVKGGLPSWISVALNKKHPGSYSKISGDAMNVLTNQFREWSWYDHAGHITVDGKQVFVSEPYSEKVNSKMIKGLEEFCELVDAEYWLSASSWHYPGRTIRIVIEPKKEKP